MNILCALAGLMMSLNLQQTDTDSLIVYLIPGQGTDHRIFNNLELDPRFEVRHVVYEVPDEHTSLKQYAEQLAQQIDTNQRFVLIGVSLGGMLATEMSQFLQPEKVIIISSAKSRNELPAAYKFQRRIPIYKLVSPALAKRGALIMQPIVEPDRNKEKETFVQMLRDKDPDFLRRTIEMIMTWDRENPPREIIHLHGEQDKTIPIRNVETDYIIPDGSHMMTLTRGEELSSLINALLLE